ncbi:response regulator [Taibaiella chishuiensis]|uniref:Response regulator receiver domain-containing protein n=1 Tax=Taibaiella chishuiensis TaxID=1434707 RepID=A0A2P8D7H6_9BACT|nr:response regulator [Taibaiella chishuiensis]PSK93180.1 response regulator receiver domain-containing protein [Taibaiella chishuiensis]
MRNILVIDDDEIIQNVLEKILVKEGFRVERAQNGKEGLAKFDLLKYDLVITDLMMPYANGFEIISKLKQHPNTANAAVIVISSITHEESVMDSFKLGVDEYIRKPIMVGELLLRIKKLLLSRPSNA